MNCNVQYNPNEPPIRQWSWQTPTGEREQTTRESVHSVLCHAGMDSLEADAYLGRLVPITEFSSHAKLKIADLRLCNAATIAFARWATRTTKLNLDKLIRESMESAVAIIRENGFPIPFEQYELLISELANRLDGEISGWMLGAWGFDDCIFAETFLGVADEIDTMIAAEVLLGERGATLKEFQAAVSRHDS